MDCTGSGSLGEDATGHKIMPMDKPRRQIHNSFCSDGLTFPSLNMFTFLHFNFLALMMVFHEYTGMMLVAILPNRGGKGRKP
jgi:hypothetical protein